VTGAKQEREQRTFRNRASLCGSSRRMTDGMTQKDSRPQVVLLIIFRTLGIPPLVSKLQITLPLVLHSRATWRQSTAQKKCGTTLRYAQSSAACDEGKTQASKRPVTLSPVETTATTNTGPSRPHFTARPPLTYPLS